MINRSTTRETKYKIQQTQHATCVYALKVLTALKQRFLRGTSTSVDNFYTTKEGRGFDSH